MRQFEFWSYEVFQSVFKTKVLKFPRHLSLSTLTTDHYSTLCYPYNRKFHQLVKVNDPRTRYWTSPPTSSRKYQSWLITSKQQRSWLKTHLHWTWCYYKRFVTVRFNQESATNDLFDELVWPFESIQRRHEWIDFIDSDLKCSHNFPL